MAELVVVSAADLRELVGAAVAEALEAAAPREQGPVLVDRQALARALGVSLATVDRLRGEPGFPSMQIGDVPRFRVERVVAWLEARCESAADDAANRQPSAPVAKGRESETAANEPDSASTAGISGSREKASSQKRNDSAGRTNGAGRSS